MAQEPMYAPPLPQPFLPNDPSSPVWAPDVPGTGVPYPKKGPVPVEPVVAQPLLPLPGSKHGGS